MIISVSIENPCAVRKDFCINCHSHFMAIRPLIKTVVVSRHFVKDLKDEGEINSIVKDVLDCSNLEHTELHKFEENIDGNLIFRAKTQGLHIVYCVDKRIRIIFLRVIKNYAEYKEFLDDKKEIKKMIAQAH